jgi:hypothetical protein
VEHSVSLAALLAGLLANLEMALATTLRQSLRLSSQTSFRHSRPARAMLMVLRAALRLVVLQASPLVECIKAVLNVEGLVVCSNRLLALLLF